jgi:hypothetical protein
LYSSGCTTAKRIKQRRAPENYCQLPAVKNDQPFISTGKLHTESHVFVIDEQKISSISIHLVTKLPCGQAFKLLFNNLNVRRPNHCKKGIKKRNLHSDAL